ncbi:MAG: CocE/NonD family hydrolase [Chitinophagaceae bacterium]|nr:MAG: CocE/NonD family hydrolase [Chitinophagaceae bacterium]
MRVKFSLALLCLFCFKLSISQSFVDSLKRDTNYIIQDSILIQTKDGAWVSAWAMRKRNVKEQLNTILQFTIYARQTDIRKMKEAADKGYAGVMAYTRGKRYSPGETVPYEYDGRDVYDVIEWITQQPWSNKKVGMYGGSYNGFTQWASTKKLHPALKTIVPSASVAPGLDVPMTNNVSMSFIFPWIYYVSNNKFLDEKDYQGPHWNELYEKWFQQGSTYRSLDTLLGRPNKVFHRWLDHSVYDTFWQSMIPYKEEFTKIDIPILSTTGYYDGGQIGEMYYYRELFKYNPNAEHYLLIGPYGHFGSQGFPDSVYNGYRIDDAARVPIHDIIYQWFDYIFKGAPKPAILKDKINYQVMGTNEWKHSPSLNKMANDSLVFYLTDKAPGNKYGLTTKKPSANSFLHQRIDFGDRNSRNSYYYFNQLIYDKLFPNNGLLLLSDPLKQETELSGNFTGVLKAAINKKDMDFSVALFELMPDGRYFLLSYFMGRASYAKDIMHRNLLVPGKKETIPFTNSYMTSRKLARGSRIAIILNINKSAFEQINYGTGGDVNKETIKDAGVPLNIKWFGDSYIKLPVWKE